MVAPLPWGNPFIQEARAKVTRKDRIEAALQAAFQPSLLDVKDESYKHAGHMPHSGGADQSGETHYWVRLNSAAFEGKTRIARHRMVNEALAREFETGLHALAIVAEVP